MSTTTLTPSRIWSLRADGRMNWHPLVRIPSLLGAAVAFGLAFWLGMSASALVGLLALLAGWALVGLLWRGPEREFAVTVYLVSMGIRLLAGAITQAVLATPAIGSTPATRGVMFEDDRAYDEIAWRVVMVWRGELPGIHRSDNYLLVNYTYLLSGLYFLIGHELLAAKWLNALVGSLASVVTFAFALHLGKPVGARLAALAMTFFPSLILWSALNLKDTWVVLLIVTTMFGMIRFAEVASNITGPFSRRDLVVILIGALTLLSFHILENLRIYVYGALGWLFGFGFLAIAWKGNGDFWRKLMYGIALTALLIGHMLTSGTRLGGLGFLNVKQAEALASNRYVISEKADTGLELPKPPKGGNPYLYHLEHLPMGVMHVLGAPTPWGVTRTKDLPMIPEMIAWYAMLGLAVTGLVTSFKSDWRRLLLPLLFTGAIIGVLGLVEGNVGTIFRHRAMLMPTTFIAAGIGLSWLLARRQTARAQTPVKVGT